MTENLKFTSLHSQDKPLIIGNVWNVQSAKVFEKLGFQAIGTSSAAVAHSLGYKDGEQMPFSDLLFLVERISKSVPLPLSVDIEFGYGQTASEVVNNVIALHKLGVVGINIEDSTIENGERRLRDGLQFSIFLHEIKSALVRNDILMFVNVRCDAFLLNFPDALQVAMQRVKWYEDARADGIFLPCIVQEGDIKEIVGQTRLPLNVMCMSQLPNFGTLQKLGVKRISMGNYLNNYAYTSLESMASKIMVEQSFNSLF